MLDCQRLEKAGQRDNKCKKILWKQQFGIAGFAVEVLGASPKSEVGAEVVAAVVVVLVAPPPNRLVPAGAPPPKRLVPAAGAVGVTPPPNRLVPAAGAAAFPPKMLPPAGAAGVVDEAPPPKMLAPVPAGAFPLPNILVVG